MYEKYHNGNVKIIIIFLIKVEITEETTNDAIRHKH